MIGTLREGINPAGAGTRIPSKSFERVNASGNESHGGKSGLIGKGRQLNARFEEEHRSRPVKINNRNDDTLFQSPPPWGIWFK